MKYQRLSQIATLAFFISILNSSAQGSETALLEKLRECQKQITLLERIKEELNAENYDLKNDNGALKAKILRLIMQNKLLKGEKVEELSEEEKMDQRLKIVIPRFRIKGNLNDVFSLVEKLSLKMDPNEQGIKLVKPNNLAAKTLNFDFENMPVGEIIRYICIASGRKYTVNGATVIVK